MTTMWRRAGIRASLTMLRARTEVAGQVRTYASDAAKSGGGSRVPAILGLTGALGGFFYAKQSGLLDGLLGAVPAAPVKPDYDAVRKAVADVMEKDSYDDGSYGPVLVRLAWHCAGTFSAADGTGGSNGATMRFDPEAGHGANAGLAVARDLLEPIKAKYPWISYADLYTLAGAVAIEEMGGPHIPWHPGRSDAADGQSCAPDGRLPDASKGAPHLRDIFYRMGFNDQEIVALSGAHTLGRCHTDRSGFDGPWTFSPITMSNQYFKELRDNKWSKRKWNGPLQYEDKSKSLMMLPTDMVLLWDRSFKKYVNEYANDEDKFFQDFATAFSRLLELGVPFSQDAPAAASPKPRAGL